MPKVGRTARRAWLLAFGLAASATARPASAQEADAGAPSQDPIGPISADSYLWLQLYAARAGILSQIAQSGLGSSDGGPSAPGPNYFTNGAEATGVPTSGPGAAYFQNGAEVFAASPTAALSPLPNEPFAPDGVTDSGAPTDAVALTPSGGEAGARAAGTTALQSMPDSSTPRLVSSGARVAGGASSDAGAAPSELPPTGGLGAGESLPGADGERGAAQRPRSPIPSPPSAPLLALTTPNDVATTAERASGSAVPWMLGALGAGVVAAALARAWTRREPRS